MQTKIKDSEGNIFTITAFTNGRDTLINGVEIKGEGGTKEISVYDLQFYTLIKAK